MSAALKLVHDIRAMTELPAALTADPWASSTAEKRRTAELRAQVVGPLADLVRAGASRNHAVQLFCARAAAQLLDANTAHVLATLAAGEPGGAAVSEPTLKRWLAAYLAHGKVGLLPAQTGRVRKDYGWEARAVELYNIPGKPGFSDVAFRLRSEGHESATESRVKRYLKALPATLGAHSPARVGQHLHKLTRRSFQRRTLDDVLVGEIYAGDGHTVDCYVAHPNTGKPFRPELTAFIDLKSRRIAGWWFTESESAVSTLYALSHALTTHQHVPAWLYIDRGAGYRAHMLADEATGWYAKFDIAVIGALPGNPHGKGWIERWFRTVRDKHDKFFAGGAVYCGDDMAPEVNRRLSAELAAGRRRLPALRDYVASFSRFVDAYHQQPMDVLQGRSPAQVWAGLQPVPLELHAEAVMRPSQTCVVARQSVRLHNRFYQHEALALYDGQRVVVEYDLHNDRDVWVQDPQGRLVCQARLVNTIGVLPTSRLDEQRDRRLQGQLKRLQRRVDEATARREDSITAADQVAAIEQLTRAPVPELAPPGRVPPAEHGGAVDIDLLSWKADE